MTSREIGQFRIFIWPTIIFIIILTVFPFLYAIALSFTDHNYVSSDQTKIVGIDNYIELFQDSLFTKSLKNTVLLVAISTFCELAIGFTLATIFFTYVRKLKKFIQTIIIMPMAMAPVAVALMWKYIFNSSYGILNYIFESLSLKPIDWLGSNAYALISIIIVDIWQWTPFVLLIVLAGYESIKRNAIDMMLVDGANKLQLLRFLILPRIMPFILVALLLRIIDTFKLFDIVYVLTEGGPGSATETLSLFGYRLGFIFFKMGLASAESIILVLLISVWTVLLIRLLKKII